MKARWVLLLISALAFRAAGAPVCGAPATAEEIAAHAAFKAEVDRVRSERAKRKPLKIFGNAVSNYERGLLRTFFTRPGLNLHVKEIFDAKTYAEALERKNFSRRKFDGNNDESDVFRHFAFATILTLKIGPKLAKETLDAHEWYSPTLDTVMDRFNNREALRFAEFVRTEWSGLNSEELEGHLLSTVKAKIADRSLVVLVPKLKCTPRPSSEFYAFAHEILQKPLD